MVARYSDVGLPGEHRHILTAHGARVRSGRQKPRCPLNKEAGHARRITRVRQVEQALVAGRQWGSAARHAEARA